jgi:predicted nuclease of restriction endonuclease-like (RecB) superfamily
VLGGDRAQYGDATIKRLAEKLVLEYGNGFGQRNLFRMVRFYQQFSDREIVTTVSAQLSWSHFVEIIKVDDAIKREFYISMAADGRWSVRTLRERMDSMLFERTAIARQPDKLIRQELARLQQQPADASPVLFLKNPYLLDFLDLKDNFSEKDMENAILLKLERFLLELGNDFAFMGRQKRIQIGGSDYCLDLLFYHRKLKRLVLIDRMDADCCRRFIAEGRRLSGLSDGAGNHGRRIELMPVLNNDAMAGTIVLPTAPLSSIPEKRAAHGAGQWRTSGRNGFPSGPGEADRRYESRKRRAG